PFKRVFGGTLGELARDCADGCLELIDSPASMERDALQEIYLEEELRAIEANAGSFWGRIARSVRRALHKRLMRRISEVERVAVGLVVRSAGSLSHLYLAQHKKQLELREIEALAPRLVEGLAQHPSIGMLLARQDGEVILITKKGRAVLNSTSLRRALGRDPQAFPFDGLDNVHYLRRLARMKNAGDLIALGHYDPQTGTVICFEDQWACHGGIGGPQQVAFMFTEQHIDWNLEIVRDANDLYPLFAHRYGLLPSAPFKGPAEQELVAVELAGATERLL
ncbi:MAG: hypothetical protein H5T69_08005, partial [Chloroflexi bacterium]|nr:hypothetical protein [Chloroflexota bacterium]